MGLQWYTSQHLHPSEMMKRLVLCLSILLLVAASCGKNDRAADREKPGEAAVHYVRNLSDGHYDEVVASMISCDSATEQYRQYIKVLYKQMVAKKKDDNGGLKSVVCVRTEDGPSAGAVNVFLKLTYDNDSIEDIILPLVWNNKKWRLR